MKIFIVILVNISFSATVYAETEKPISLLEKRLEQLKTQDVCEKPKVFMHPPGARHLYDDVYFEENIGRYRVVNGVIVPIPDIGYRYI